MFDVCPRTKRGYHAQTLHCSLGILIRPPRLVGELISSFGVMMMVFDDEKGLEYLWLFRRFWHPQRRINPPNTLESCT
jgi:hypothetical protein